MNARIPRNGPEPPQGGDPNPWPDLPTSPRKETRLEAAGSEIKHVILAVTAVIAIGPVAAALIPPVIFWQIATKGGHSKQALKGALSA